MSRFNIIKEFTKLIPKPNRLRSKPMTNEIVLNNPAILPRFDDPYRITKVSGDKIRLRLPSHTQESPREIVLVPHENNLYELHIRTWDGDHIPANLNPQEKTALFESVYNELPEGAEILFPKSSADYPATRGTVAALVRLSRDPRFIRGKSSGTLMYLDKDGTMKTFEGTGFIKNEVSPELVPFQSKDRQYLVDAFNPEHRRILIQKWLQRYPESELLLLSLPIVYDNGNLLKIGTLPMHSRTKAMADLMRNRWKNFNIRGSAQPDTGYATWIRPGGGRQITLKGYNNMFDKLKESEVPVYIPINHDYNFEGFYSDRLGANMKLNPFRTKPYLYTQLHEGISHTTDTMVRDMFTKKGRRVLSDNEPSLYGKLSNPTDIYDSNLINRVLSRSSKKPIEARAVNWEMIEKIYARIAKESGISFEDAVRTKTKEFEQFVRSMSSKDLYGLMESMDNSYCKDYATLLRTGSELQAQAFTDRWKQALIYAPVLFFGAVGINGVNSK